MTGGSDRVRRTHRVVLVALLAAPPALSQVSVRPVFDALQLETGSLPAGAAFGRSLVPALVRMPWGTSAAGSGGSRIGKTFVVRSAPLHELAELAGHHPDWQVTWSAPLRPLSDRAGQWIGLPGMRASPGRTGQGVLVGIADTGVDVMHADLRNPDGTTRLAYLVDFSAPPLGRNAALEGRCTAAGLSCAVLGASDIDARLAAGGAGLSPDLQGHGTHVASLAAGNGGDDGRYAGIAPEARLVVANVVQADGSISDAGVLLAVDLLFRLAEEEGQKVGKERLPMVVNLSLGSDFGAHDGTSPLEQALSELVGPELPGRSIVAAAGNSSVLITADSAFPDPLGVHTDVHVPGGSVQVPIVAFPPAAAGDELEASLLVWITFRPGDDLSVGVDRRSGSFIAPIGPGERRVRTSEGKLAVTVLHGVSDTPDGPGAGSAAVLVEGAWPRRETFAIRLEGHGTASLWVQSEGELLPGGLDPGALFPAATSESTVTIPASSAALIAVGATLNRTDWVDRTGTAHRVGTFGGTRDPAPDTVAFFSSAGPTMDSRMKPDLLAPGAFVVGAMSRSADPRTSGFSIFTSGYCAPVVDCNVVDDAHAVTLGTSMASPIVAGAVALLFEGDPELTQPEILARLQAGARRPAGGASAGAQWGAGVLDLEGVLDVERAQVTTEGRGPSPATSWLSLGAALARPDPGWGIPAVLHLRDVDGRRAPLPDPAKLDIEVQNGRLIAGGEAKLPGFHPFTVAASPGTGGATLRVTVRHDGVPVARASLPIAVDTGVGRDGFTARGGCSVAGRRGVPREAPASGLLTAGLLLGVLALGRRSPRRAHCRTRYTL